MMNRVKYHSTASQGQLRSTAWAMALVLAAGCNAEAVDPAQEGDSGTTLTHDDATEESHENDGDGSHSDDDDDTGVDSSGDDGDDEDEDNDDDDGQSHLTYYRDAKAIIDAKCANCHVDGDIGPFPLTTYDEVYKLRSLIRNAVELGTMPPWSPASECQSFDGSRALTTSEKDTILAWIDDDAREGDPDDFDPADDDSEEVDYNLILKMPEPYTPSKGPDDYRCFLIDWPGDKTQYMKAFAVEPGRRDMLHHLLVYKVGSAQAAQFKLTDLAEAGQGYTCFGGPAPGVHPNAVELIGEWVPGQSELPLPRGVGLKFEPGDVIIAQHHYNTAFVGAQSDQSTYKMRFEDEADRAAIGSVFFDSGWLVPGGMSIPAGEADVMHEWKVSIRDSIGKMAEKIGASASDALAIQVVGPHLHQLGLSASVEIIRANGGTECLIDLPKWDFNWQGGYTLSEEFVVQPDDILHLTCHWDNSQDNQPMEADGTQATPQNVEWGDGTRDEMCLVGLMFAKAK
jgi:hypothetical protein